MWQHVTTPCRWLALGFVAWLAPSWAAEADPVYITMFRDPCHALEAHRLCPASTTLTPATVVVDGVAREVPVTAVSLPGTTWTIHRAVVGNLPAASDVTVRFDGASTTRVRTLPERVAGDTPLRLVNGGDTMHKAEWLAQTTRVMVAHDPALIVFGGDLAYENGKDGARVVQWIQTYAATARTSDGRVVPFVSSIGNHEVVGHYGGTPAQAPYFFALLPLDGRAYHAVDIGTWLTLVLLDTDHATRIPGPQTTWLQQTLSERRARTTVIPVYHYPAWPVVKAGAKQFPADDRVSKLVREHWVPLFEAHQVRVVLEHDQHAFKRTVPLRQGQPAADGVTYLGDGAWGVEVRPIHPQADPTGTIMAKTASVRHGWLLDCYADGRVLATAIDEHGTTIDQVRIPPAPRTP